MAESKSTVNTEERAAGAPETGASTAATAEATQQAARTGGKDEEETFNPEEEVTEGNWTTPQVEVKEVKVETGEEDEDVFWKCRSKLYRWMVGQGSAASGEWKERGLGEAKLLRHRHNRKIRFLLRQEKTLKIVANHYVVATDVYCRLSPNIGSEKIWVWTVMDFADGELKNEQFALKFGQVEQAREFKEKFEAAASANALLFGVAAPSSLGDSDAATSKSEKAPQSPSEGSSSTSKDLQQQQTEKEEAVAVAEKKQETARTAQSEAKGKTQ